MKRILNSIHWGVTLVTLTVVLGGTAAALSLGFLSPTLNATMVSHSETIASNTTDDFTVSCSSVGSDYIAVSASWSTNNPDMAILKSQPAPTAQNQPNNQSTAWEFYVSNYSTWAPSQPFDVQVLCVKE